jgi:hypothetical protein
VDDRLVHQSTFFGKARRRLLLFREHSGRARAVVQVAPGSHVVRVEVTSDGFRSARAVRGTFEGGHGRELVARVGGAVKREIQLAWEGA